MNPVNFAAEGQLQSLLDNAAVEKKQQVSKREDELLKKACNDFETVLTKTILKEGMKNAKEMGGDEETEDGDKGSESFKEMAYEQLAEFMGKQGSLGLGRSLYESFKMKMDKTTGAHK